MRQKGKEDDSDIHLAQGIMKNKQYNMSTQADDEYDYDGLPTKKSRRKGAERDNRTDTKQHLGKRIVTQQERCVYCFENPKRPKHLVVAIANFTYLMLPQYQPVAPGHCCIVTLQVESVLLLVWILLMCFQWYINIGKHLKARNSRLMLSVPALPFCV